MHTGQGDGLVSGLLTLKMKRKERNKITNVIKVDNLYFDVFVEGLEYNIRIRLNWGNNNGIANPRWKFTFIDK